MPHDDTPTKREEHAATTSRSRCGNDDDDDDYRLRELFGRARTATTNKARDAALRAAQAHQRSKEAP